MPNENYIVRVCYFIWDFFFKMRLLGFGNVGQTSLRACSKYTVNRTGFKLSPCGVLTLLVNGFDVEVPFILVSMTVPLIRNYISLSSSRSTIDFTLSRRWRLFIVSKAADISIPEMLIVVSSFSAFAASHLCVHITSAVLRSGRNPLWFLDRYSSTCGLIRFRVDYR